MCVTSVLVSSALARELGLSTQCYCPPTMQDGGKIPVTIIRDAFTAYVEQVRVLELKPGDMVIMDNLSIHKAPAVQETIEAVGARLRFRTPYSPSFNPIEKACSKLNAHLHKDAERAFYGLRSSVGPIVDLYPP